MDNEATTKKKPHKTKDEIKKELDESLVNGETHDNTEIDETGTRIEKPEDAATVIREFEEIIKSKKKNMTCLAYQQRRTFCKFNEREKIAKIITELGVIRLTISFNISTVILTDKHLKIRNSSLYLYFVDEAHENSSRYL